jgi:hypothetical protein
MPNPRQDGNWHDLLTDPMQVVVQGHRNNKPYSQFLCRSQHHRCLRISSTTATSHAEKPKSAKLQGFECIHTTILALEAEDKVI